MTRALIFTAFAAVAAALASAERVWTPVFPAPEPTPKRFELDLVTVDHEGAPVLAGSAWFGTPPQPFHLMILMWDSDCSIVKDNWHNIPFYDHSRSTSYTPNGTEVSSLFGPQGFTSRDRIVLGKNGVALDDALFIEVTDESFHGNRAYQGSCGLGYANGDATGTPSFMRTLIQQSKLEKPVVGVSVGHAENETVHLTIGWLDEKRFRGEVKFVDVVQSPYGDWRLPLHTLVVGDKPVAVKSNQTVIVTMDRWLAGPIDQVVAIADALGADTFVLPCDSPLPDITIDVGNDVKLVLTKDDYLHQRDGSCFLGIGDSGDDAWFIGLGAVSNTYAVLDYGNQLGEERVGFASATSN